MVKVSDLVHLSVLHWSLPGPFRVHDGQLIEFEALLPLVFLFIKNPYPKALKLPVIGIS